MSILNDYRQKILAQVKKELNLKNIWETPRLEKIVLNIGIGSYTLKKDKDFSPLQERLKAISGQAPVLVKAKKSVSNFKLREGMPNGLKVTLRGKRMLAFLDRLINVSLPRTRDFRGVSKKAFDQDGNYSLGIKEVTIFPEVKIDDVSKIHGMQINIVTNTKDKEQSRVLLKNIGIPFAN
jgi:large subunit ribosomal protein L5